MAGMKSSIAQLVDPRRAPVIQVDRHLPAVGVDVLTPQGLRERFLRPPTWQPEWVAEKKFVNCSPQQAAVLVPIVSRPVPTVLLTQRTAHLSTHAGQIAFPGGKVDPHDADSIQTACREAHEEVGLARECIDVLGCLPPYTTGSAFVVTPVVALVRPDVPWTPNPHEVSDVFEVPLAFLMDPQNHRHHEVVWQGELRHWLSMPYSDAQGERFIWGATAGMLRNFYRFLSA